MRWWSWGREIQFNVTMELKGVHPYVTGRRDYPDRSVFMVVSARSWNAAEREALRRLEPGSWWSARVVQISKVQT